MTRESGSYARVVKNPKRSFWSIFLRNNLEWLSRAANWAKFSATAALGVIHRGHLSQALQLLRPYLPQQGAGAGASSPYSEGGALYGAVRAPWRAGPLHSPAHRSPLRPWLWRVGASVHPGGGLPAVLGGAMISTGKLLERLERDRSRAPADRRPRGLRGRR